MANFSHFPFKNAKYIKAQQTPSEFSLYDPAPMFRKEFILTGEIRNAVISVQSPGFAVFYINGQPITEDKFISPVSDYRKILWYNTYDVTELLKSGKNTVCVICGNGFLNESFDSAWHYSSVSWRDAPQFILSLIVNGEEALVSDKTWKCSRDKSHIIYNHLRSGEYVDMRKYDSLWMDKDYNDSDWECALERKAAVTAEFLKVQCQPVREVEAISPIEIKKTKQGYLIDFGVTISGYMEITLKELSGTEILFRYTEDIFDDFTPNLHGMDAEVFFLESPFQLNKLIASGGTDTFKPQFSYHGFRYVIIEGLSNPPTTDSVKAYFLHQDIAKIADFESGNPIINYIYNGGIRSTYSNLFWSLTDCPTREKLGWANDAQATIEQSLINFDIVPLLKKWFEDIKSSMKDDGSLPGIIPSPDWGFDWGPMCDGLLYELPYRVYLYTGDSSMLTESLDYFDRYVEYLYEKIKEGYEFSSEDWLGYANNTRIPKAFVADFYLIKALSITVFAHRLANQDEKIWESRFNDAKKQFLNTYLKGDGRCIIDEQSAVAMLLATELYEEKQPLCEQMVSVVERDNRKITCGMVGIQYLFDALTACGRPDLAYYMITESEPGYKNWYEQGATTLWENWECRREGGSKNHHMFSNVIGWFYKSLLGINIQNRSFGFEQINLQPCFIKELGFAKGYMKTVKGCIEAEWEFKNDHFVYTVTIPDGIKANFNGKTLLPGSNRFLIAQQEI